MGKRILIGIAVAFAALVAIGTIEEASQQTVTSSVAEASIVESSENAEGGEQRASLEDSASPAPTTSTTPATGEQPPANGIDPGIDEASLDAVLSDLDSLLGELTNSFNQTEGDLQP